MRRAVQQHRDGVQNYEGGKVEGVLAAARQVAVQLIVDTISKIGLLEHRPLCRVGLTLGEERGQGCYVEFSLLDIPYESRAEQRQRE